MKSQCLPPLEIHGVDAFLKIWMSMPMQGHNVMDEVFVTLRTVSQEYFLMNLHFAEETSQAFFVTCSFLWICRNLSRSYGCRWSRRSWSLQETFRRPDKTSGLDSRLQSSSNLWKSFRGTREVGERSFDVCSYLSFSFSDAVNCHIVCYYSSFFPCSLSVESWDYGVSVRPLVFDVWSIFQLPKTCSPKPYILSKHTVYIYISILCKQVTSQMANVYVHVDVGIDVDVDIAHNFWIWLHSLLQFWRFHWLDLTNFVLVRAWMLMWNGRMGFFCLRTPHLTSWHDVFTAVVLCTWSCMSKVAEIIEDQLGFRTSSELQPS